MAEYGIKRLERHCPKFVMSMIACLVLCATGYAMEYKEFFSAAEIAAAPAPKVKSKHKDVGKETEFAIVRMLRMTREKVVDVNMDGKINCIDYTLTFKVLWDRYYEQNECIIIRNVNPNTGMSHLFVAVFDCKTMSYVDIEPWTKDFNRWQMVDVWKNVYDIYYNLYDEEDYWMGKVRRNIR